MAAMSVELLSNLNCGSCGHYLSVGPIVRLDTGYKCGRCLVENPGIEPDALGEVLKGQRFPCKYDVYGCKQRLTFGNDIKSHEDICLFKPIICPMQIIDQCEKLVDKNQLINHFLSAHKSNIIQELTFGIKVDYTEDIKLYTGKGGCYVINHSFDKVNGFKFAVFGVDTEMISQTEAYTIHLKSEGSSIRNLSMSGKVLCYPGENTDPLHCVLDISIFKHIFQKVETVSVELGLPNDNKHVNYSRCLGCAQKLLYVLYQCKSDHLFCKKCGSESDDICMICSKALCFARNPSIPLEDNVIYSCINEIFGCSYWGKPYQLKEHNCSNSLIINCPFKLNSCHWKGFESALLQHCQQNHQVFNNELQISLENISDSIYVLLYNNFLFVLNVRYHDGKKVVYFNVETRQKGYSFDLTCLNNQQTSIKHRHPCSPILEEVSDYYKHSIGICMDSFCGDCIVVSIWKQQYITKEQFTL